jgi:hypothetical protein
LHEGQGKLFPLCFSRTCLLRLHLASGPLKDLTSPLFAQTSHRKESTQADILAFGTTCNVVAESTRSGASLGELELPQSLQGGSVATFGGGGANVV